MIVHKITPIDRFLHTLGIVAKEAKHLEWSRTRLFEQNIDAAWTKTYRLFGHLDILRCDRPLPA
ncbi:MAG: hypothetical protein QMD17_07140 [Rhodocyclaceae bacterium]|nr:hypothetical protein [Rhodocyclaceae bacterium]